MALISASPTRNLSDITVVKLFPTANRTSESFLARTEAEAFPPSAFYVQQSLALDTSAMTRAAARDHVNPAATLSLRSDVPSYAGKDAAEPARLPLTDRADPLAAADPASPFSAPHATPSGTSDMMAGIFHASAAIEPTTAPSHELRTFADPAQTAAPIHITPVAQTTAPAPVAATAAPVTTAAAPPMIKGLVVVDGDAHAVGKVSQEMFGAVAPNSTGYHSFAEDCDYMGVTSFRMPGGTIREQGVLDEDGDIVLDDAIIMFNDLLDPARTNIAYDITFPELINPIALAADEADGGNDEVATLSQIFEDAVRHGASAGITMPTERYSNGLDFSDPDDLERAYDMIEHDVKILLDNLKSGDINCGSYPSLITFCIGNENYAHPIEYALIVAKMMDVIEEEMKGSGINYGICIQMGTGSSQWQTNLENGELDPFFDKNGNPTIPELAGFTMQELESLSYDERMVATDSLMIAILGDRITDIMALRHHYLKIDLDTMQGDTPIMDQRAVILGYWLDNIARLGGSVEDVLYAVTAWSVTGDNATEDAFSMAAAVNMIDFFDYMIREGVDIARVWGITGAYNLSSYTEGSVLTISNEDADQGYAPAAETFRLMSEVLIDMKLLDVGANLTLTDDRTDDYLMSAYEDANKVVLFIGVGELEGADFRLWLDVSGFGQFTAAEAELVITIDGADSGFATTVTQEVQVVNGQVYVTFDQDWQVARIILEKPDFNEIDAAGSGKFTGTSDSDRISGGTKDNILNGYAGDDTIRDTGGTNTLYGGDGSDWIQGGVGRDTMIGDDGEDDIRDPLGNSHVDAGTGDDRITLITGVGNVSGEDGSDLIRTGYMDDKVYGGKGNDIIDADYGAGFLVGDDRIEGGPGADLLRGDPGADVFVFHPSDGNDKIADFNTDLARYTIGSGYSVDLTGADFDPGTDQINLVGFSSVNARNVMSFVEQTDSGALFSAEGTTILFRSVDLKALSADDFIFS